MSSMLTFFALVSVVMQLVTSQGPYKRVCYYTNWAQYRPNAGKFMPEDVDPNLCTHIIYAFAKMRGNQLEAFEWNDESTDWMKGMFTRFNELKMKNRGLKTLLAVGGWNMASKPFTAMVATPASRREFATTSVKFLRDRNFDGLDLDWEYPANRGSPPGDRRRYAELVTEIRRAFNEDSRRTGKEALLLTSAVAAGKDKIDTAYDIPSICRDMDFISIMAYDLHGSWEDISGHNSPLFPHSGETGNQRFLNMDWAANYWTQNGCPKHKLVIGMGLYGRSFTLKDQYDNGLMAPVKGKGKAGKFSREGGFLAYYEICDMIKKGAQTYYIKEQEAPYIVMKDQWVGYDDIDSLRIKVQWMKQNGYAGIMVWALDLDDFKGTSCGQGRYPLMKTITRELRGSIGRPPKSRKNRVKSEPKRNQNNNNQPSWQTDNRQPTTSPPKLPHLTDEFKCPASTNTYFESPHSCEDYFICASGLSFKFTCTPPLRWNAVNNFCDWPVNVRCNKKRVKTQPAQVPRRRKPSTRRPRPTTTTTTTTTTRPPPPPTTQPIFDQPTPPWLDWSAWIAEFWKALTTMAGGHSAWMQQTLQTAASQATSHVSGPKKFCDGKNDGIHTDPLDCSKYIDCVQGREYSGSCPTGTAFDNVIGICDYTHKISRCAVQGVSNW